MFGEPGVRAGGDDDRVAAVIVDGDERAAGPRAVDDVDMAGVDALAGQRGAHDVAVGVVAARADHGGRRTGA